MNMSVKETQNAERYWDERATKGFTAGTNDAILKKLEIREITALCEGEKIILDAGCGNGHTILSIAEHNPTARIFGFDSSGRMIEEASITDYYADSVDQGRP